MSEIVMTSGCAVNANEKMSNAESLLEKKYGEDFTVIEYCGSEPMENWYSVRAYATNYPDIVFGAEIFPKDGISDTYVQRRVSSVLKDNIENVLKDLDGGFVVFVSPTTDYTVSKDPMISPEKFNEENRGNEFYICLFYDGSKYDTKMIYSTVKKVAEEVGGFKGYIETVITDKDHLDKVSVYFTEQDDIYSQLNDMLAEAKRNDIRYENGKLLTNYSEFVGGLR